jgi:hypothetical protein
MNVRFKGLNLGPQPTIEDPQMVHVQQHAVMLHRSEDCDQRMLDLIVQGP